VFATPYLSDFFLGEFKQNGSFRKAPLAGAYCDLIQKVKTGYESTITPTELKNAVSKRAPQFSGYGQ
jgi:hypothetical protein